MKSWLLTALGRIADLNHRLSRNKKLITLIYHRVLDQPDPMRPGEIDKTTFAWQMALLAQHFIVLPMPEAVARLYDNSLPPRAICISFDDGYADNYHNALPILQQHNLTATFFIASGFLDGGRMWNDTIIETVRRLEGPMLDLTAIGLDRYRIDSLERKAEIALAVIQNVKHLPIIDKARCLDTIEALTEGLPNDLMLTSAQVNAMHDHGMIIGGHTVSHPILTKMTTPDVIREVQENQATLTAITGTPIEFFAYPNGKAGVDYLPEQSAIIQSLGFKAAFSTHLGCANRYTDRWQLPRFRPWDNTPQGFMTRLVYMYTKTGLDTGEA